MSFTAAGAGYAYYIYDGRILQRRVRRTRVSQNTARSVSIGLL